MAKLNVGQTNANIITAFQAALAAVRTDIAQTLSDTQKAQARTNIGAGSAADTSNLQTRMGTAETELSVLDARMDEFASLPDGSTAGDAELLDIRVGYNGKIWPSAGDAVRGQVTDLKSAFNDTLDMQIVAESKAVTASLSTTGAYFLDTGRYINTVGSQFIVTQYPVKKGLSYNLKGTVSLQVTAGLIAFDTDGTLENNQVLTTVIKTCGNTSENVNVDYTATEDGFLYVASVTGRGTLTVTQTTKYDSERIIRLEDFNDLIANNVSEVQYPLDYETVTQLYIASNGTFTYASDGTRFRVYYFPVEEGKKYRVVYNDHSMLAAYGAISFSTAIPASSGTSTVLLLATTTDTDIDFEYTATADGYLCIDKATSSTNFAFYEYGIEIQTSVQKKSLKIQLFGDSITDDYWGDQRTWATILPQYMTEYDLTIVNSAVGGSAIGYHGHSGSGRYAEKTYNYVADLLTDGTLETDSDVIVVLIGTNNWGGSYPPLGVFGDKASIDPDTGTGTGFSKFYGCIEFVIDYISTNTDALLIIATPPQRYNAADEARSVDSYGAPLNNNNNTLRQLCDAFKISCEFYGIPCLDLNSELGWNRINIDNFTTDGLHPNNVGDEWLAQLISSEIKKHLHN